LREQFSIRIQATDWLAYDVSTRGHFMPTLLIPTNLQASDLYVFWGLLLGIFRAEIQRSILFMSTPARSQNHIQSASSAKLPIRM
jgi:hypothetical protein